MGCTFLLSDELVLVACAYVLCVDLVEIVVPPVVVEVAAVSGVVGNL